MVIKWAEPSLEFELRTCLFKWVKDSTIRDSGRVEEETWLDDKEVKIIPL